MDALVPRQYMLLWRLGRRPLPGVAVETYASHRLRSALAPCGDQRRPLGERHDRPGGPDLDLLGRLLGDLRRQRVVYVAYPHTLTKAFMPPILRGWRTINIPTTGGETGLLLVTSMLRASR